MAEAQVLIRPNTARFRAELEAQLKAATKGIIIPVAAAPVSAGNVAVQQKAVKTAREEGRVLRDNAKATREAAKAHEALARGAGSSLLSMLGVRGATLAASTAFLGGAAAVTLLAKSVEGAVEDQETLFRVTRILGTELGEGSRQWSQKLVNSFGLADDAALKFEGSFAEVFHNIGIAPEQNAKLSQSLVELAADMAAFAHVPVEATLKALQSGISGNTRGLRQFIGEISRAETAQEALRETGKQSADQLTKQELTLARVNLIQEAAANQVGSFAARADELSGKSAILKANLDALGDSIGGPLLGALSEIVGEINKAVKGFKFLVEVVDRFTPATERGDGSATAFGQALHFLGQGAKFAALGAVSLPVAIAEATREMLKGSDAARELNGSLTQIGFAKLMGDIPLVTNLLGQMSNAFDVAAAKFRQGLHLQVTITTNQLDTRNRNLLRAQAEGAPLSTQLGLAQQAIDAAQKRVAAVDRLAGLSQSVKQKKQTDALNDLLAARNAQEGIQSEIDSANKSVASGTAKAAKSAQEILDEQDQQLTTAQDLAQGLIEIVKEKARGTKSLVDDLEADRKQVALIRRQIVEARKIHDETLRKQTIQRLTLDLIQTQNDIDQLRRQQAENRAERRKARIERQFESVDLDIDLAQTNKNVQAEIRARQRRIRLDEQRKRQVRGDIIATKQLRNDIAAQRAAIKELRKELAGRNDDLRRLEFDFLQTQAGFAATLLSNLLPTSAVAGTVGGGAISTPTGDLGPGPADFATAAHKRPGKDLGAAAQVAAQAGPTSGQFSTLITIQRSQLNVLLRLVGQRTHPEATHQRTWTATEMLNTGW